MRLGLEGLKAFARSIPEALPHPSILSTNWRVQAEACPRLSWPLGRGTLFADPRVISAATAGSGPARQHFLNARDQGIFFSVGLSGSWGVEGAQLQVERRAHRLPLWGERGDCCPQRGRPGTCSSRPAPPGPPTPTSCHCFPLLSPLTHTRKVLGDDHRNTGKNRKQGIKLTPFANTPHNVRGSLPHGVRFL